MLTDIQSINPLILKLILTPFLIAMATLAVRRWGFVLGGLFTGLPLTSGPVSLFLALEQGPRFAGQGSHGMLLGTVALAAFCVAYVRTARGPRWLPPLIVGLAVYLLAAWSLSFFSLNLAGLTLLVLLLPFLSSRALWGSLPRNKTVRLQLISSFGESSSAVSRPFHFLPLLDLQSSGPALPLRSPWPPQPPLESTASAWQR